MLLQRLTSAKRASYTPRNELALPKAVDAAFEGLLEAERKFIGCGARFPVGGSRFVVARRPPT
jgi:hypothetical protein